jgi:hypothetical protein
VVVAGGASGGWRRLHRREGGRGAGAAGLTVHGAFRPVKTLNSVVEHVEGLQVA